MTGSNWFSKLALLQGGFYLLTGLWSLVSPRTFQMVTGPKKDYWLVRTVGILVSVIGGVLALAGLRGQSTREVPLLAVGSALGLGAIDVVYATKGRISKVYLLDAAVEAALVAAWAFVRRRGRSVSLLAELFRSRDETYRDAGPLDTARTAERSGEALGI